MRDLSTRIYLVSKFYILKSITSCYLVILFHWHTKTSQRAIISYKLYNDGTCLIVGKSSEGKVCFIIFSAFECMLVFKMFLVLVYFYFLVITGQLSQSAIHNMSFHLTLI